MSTLFLIPARGGSKGIPGKNIKPLAGKPLIYYSIDIARAFSGDALICVSTDDPAIIKTVEDYGLKVPFRRPDSLATDSAGSYEVIVHALDWYRENGFDIDTLVLLQPTSPLRIKRHVQEAMNLLNEETEMVTSVKKTKSNPFHLLYTENESGFIEKAIKGRDFDRRQDVPQAYELNGAVYVIQVASLRKRKISEFEKVKKYEMPRLHSVDIDEPEDWVWAEYLLERKIINISDNE
jgi:CMP-N,N'-diacetyllegionaminic acid synthase